METNTDLHLSLFLEHGSSEAGEGGGEEGDGGERGMRGGDIEQWRTVSVTGIYQFVQSLKQLNPSIRHLSASIISKCYRVMSHYAALKQSGLSQSYQHV